MTYEPGIDIVVVNYRTPNDLLRFLRSLDEHPPTVPWTAHIANVCPTDKDVDVASEWVAGREHWMTTHLDNVGYAYACNVEAARTGREVIAFFNADVALTAGALDTCHKALMANDRWGILGPRQVDDHGRLTHAGIFGNFTQLKHRGWMATRVEEYDDVRDDAMSVSGAAYFVKREVWDQMAKCPDYLEAIPDAPGAFLPTKLFYEETWLSVHAKAHGYQVVYYGPVCIIHNWHQAIRQAGVKRWADQMMTESHERYRHACRTHGIPHD